MVGALQGSRTPLKHAGPIVLDTVLQCTAFGLQALQDIEPRQRPTGLLDQPTIAQSA